MRAGREQLPHVRQAARPVHRVQRLEVVLRDGQRHVHVAVGAEHAGDRRGVGRDEVRGEGEDGLAEVRQDAGEPAHRRAGHLVRDDDDAVGQVGRRLVGAAHRQTDDGEDAAEEREVAPQQRLAAQAQPALVAAHAPRLAAGEQDADAHRVRGCRLGVHREDAV